MASSQLGTVATRNRIRKVDKTLFEYKMARRLLK
jgi:hypothetical protein